MTFRLAAAFVLILSMLASSAYAADFTEDCDGLDCNILLRGPITAGDAAKFKDTVLSIRKRGQYIEDLYLMSPGGLVDEAIEIGRIVRSGLMSTYAPYTDTFSPFTLSELEKLPEEQAMALCEGVCGSYFYLHFGQHTYTNHSGAAAGANKFGSIAEGAEVDGNTLCASACALVALSGVFRLGTVGLHHIYIPSGELDFSDLERRLVGGGTQVEKYLREMRVPSKIIDRVFATSSSDMDWMSFTIESLADDPIFREYLNGRCGGYSEELSDEQFRLKTLRDTGVYFNTDTMTTYKRSFTRDDARRLATLEERLTRIYECKAREREAARHRAQANLK